MKKILIIGFLLGAAAIATFYGFNITSGEHTYSSEMNTIDMPDLKGWPDASQKAAKEMETKYGKPSASTPDMVIWNNNGTWLKTIVYKKEMKHDFPKTHMDVVEQWVNYRVPLTDYCKLAMYDGSVTANRTNGTISARCDKEAMNILALNLSYDIIKNNKSVEQAREDYAKDAMAFMDGKKPGSTQKLNFTSDPSAPDSDKPMDMTKMKSSIGGQ